MSQRSAAWPIVSDTASLTLAALIALFIAAVPLLWSAGARLDTLLSYPYPNDPLEGTLLHEARLMRAGEPLYQPLEPYRFVSAPYPPLHPLLLAQADRFPGPHEMWSGRLVSSLSALVVALLIVLIPRSAGGSWLTGVVCATVFLSAPPVLLWATRIKPDLFCLTLVCLGLLFASLTLAAEQSGQSPMLVRYGPALSAFFFVLALFARQTAVIAPFATGLALLVADLRTPYDARSKIWRVPLPQRALVFGLTYLILAASIWLLLDLFTEGNYTAHVWGLHRSEWWSLYLVRKYVQLLLPYLPLAMLALVVIARALRHNLALVPALYALLAPMSLLGAAEIGANHNHLLETVLALCIAGGAAVAVAQPLYRTLPLVLLLGLQLGIAYQPQAWFIGELEPRDPPERFLHFIRNTPGEILADDVGLLLFAGKPIRYDDPSTMGPAAVSGVWDQSGLIDDIANKRFSAIMIPDDVDERPYDNIGRWTTEVRAAIKQHYQPKFRDRIRTYVPR